MTRLEGIYRSNALAEDVKFFNHQGVTLVDNVWRDRIIPEIKRP